MRVVFLGSGPFALPALETLFRLRRRYPLAAVVSRPDRPSGRGRRLEPTPVRRRAVELGLDCRAPLTANEPSFLAELAAFSPDLFVVADYGELLREPLLAVPRIGAFNLHASLLPRYRGAAPVAHAILDGERETGVTLFRVEKGLDSGPIVAVARAEIGTDESAGELEGRLSHLAAELLERELPAFAAGAFREVPQDSALATRAPKLSKEDGRIEWSRGAREVHDLVRAMNPWPRAFTFLERRGLPPARVTILRVEPLEGSGAELAGAEPGSVASVAKEDFVVACGRGSVRVRELQLAGKPAMEAAAFLRGHPLEPGDRFTSHPEGAAQ